MPQSENLDLRLSITAHKGTDISRGGSAEWSESPQIACISFPDHFSQLST